MNLEYLGLGSLDCDHVKSPIPDMDCEIIMWVMNLSLTRIEARGDIKNSR